jgi:hypothetical protein
MPIIPKPTVSAIVILSLTPNPPELLLPKVVLALPSAELLSETDEKPIDDADEAVAIVDKIEIVETVEAVEAVGIAKAVEIVKAIEVFKAIEDVKAVEAVKDIKVVEGVEDVEVCHLLVLASQHGTARVSLNARTGMT